MFLCFSESSDVLIEFNWNQNFMVLYTNLTIQERVIFIIFAFFCLLLYGMISVKESGENLKRSLGKKKLEEKVIIDKMRKIMYPINGNKEGLIISIINKWNPSFGFIIVSSSNDKSIEIYNKMLRIWSIKQ